MNENKVLAVVNGKEITEQDVQILLRSLDQQRAMQFYSPEGQKRLLEELINQELFYVDAVETNLEEDEAFKAEVEMAKANILKQYALRKLLNAVSVTEEEIVNYYNENKEMFKEPESARASHILVPTEEEINNIAKEIKEGLSFEDAAKKYSKCPSGSNGGDLGFFSAGKMVPEFEEAAFKMNINEVSEPIKTQFGYHLIKLVDKKDAGVSELDSIKSEIGQQLMSIKQNKLYVDKTNELRSKYEVIKK